MSWFLAYLALGAVAGFFAGLLGIGGGAVIVPLLVIMFSAQGFADAHLMHLVLGTSMATIIFTSLSSMRTHHQHQAVNWAVVKTLSPGIIVGTLLGAQLASHVATRPLAIFFAVFMTYVAVQMVINAKPSPARELPGRAGMLGAGFGIGAISALAAVGGGSLTVPFLLWCNVKMHHAIGTSAAVGLPIALAGTVGYMISGLSATGLPAGSFGFIYLPALAGTVLASALVAPLGARLAHRLPVATLKKIFAGVILLLLAKMLHGLFSQ
ncbi:MAG: sulfite exporter TauE/SafE family protein [Rugosibacter sp.]|nr:sulfite exporter TauE/SafE family protein [Rugosibacter sp.]